MPYSTVTFTKYRIQVAWNKGEKTADRYVWIEPDSVTGDPVAGVFMLFTDYRQPPDTYGQYVPDDHWVVAVSWVQDYESAFELLKSSKELTFSFYADSPSNEMVWFNLVGSDSVAKRFRRSIDDAIASNRFPRLPALARDESPASERPRKPKTSRRRKG